MLAVASFFLGVLVCFGQSDISKIDIKSEWGGLGEPSSSHLVIKQSNGRFYSGSRRIKDEDIKSFVGAVENSAIQKWGLPSLGITGEWLKANAPKALKGYLPKWQYKTMSERQRELFFNSFSNYDLMEKILTNGVSNDAGEEEVDFRL